MASYQAKAATARGERVEMKTPKRITVNSYLMLSGHITFGIDSMKGLTIDLECDPDADKTPMMQVHWIAYLEALKILKISTIIGKGHDVICQAPKDNRCTAPTLAAIHGAQSVLEYSAGPGDYSLQASGTPRLWGPLLSTQMQPRQDRGHTHGHGPARGGPTTGRHRR
ncbi:hypothetical protein EJB05_56102, partial [Eragrostis curvula]